MLNIAGTGRAVFRLDARPEDVFYHFIKLVDADPFSGADVHELADSFFGGQRQHVRTDDVFDVDEVAGLPSVYSM